MSTTELRYLQRKNEQFFKTVRELVELDLSFEVQLWVEEDPETARDLGFYDLVVVNFHDEGGYDRSITIPAPMLYNSRTKGARLLLNWLEAHLDEVTLCDRSQYSRQGWRHPIPFWQEVEV